MAWALLMDASMKKSAIAIGSPCTVDWKSMTVVDGGRFCGDCRKVVRNLSAMTEEEAKALLAGPRQAELCVRYMHDRDGEVVFAKGTGAPDLVPASFLHRARRNAATLVAAVAPFALAACSDAPPEASHDESSERTTEESDDSQLSYVMGTAPNYPVTSDEDAGADAESPEDASDAATDGGTADGGDAGTDGGPSHL
ncbi:MAG: hypothetical protein U0169_08690 [Polyangiaceae bacterium]